jgi:hypothetical protein
LHFSLRRSYREQMVELDTVSAAQAAQLSVDEHTAPRRAKALGGNKVAFFITPDQLDALRALESSAARPLAFKLATWLALVKKGLVRLDPEPGLTPAGRAYLSFNRALEAVNRVPEAEGPKAGE